jgi:hypothetical protein
MSAPSPESSLPQSCKIVARFSEQWTPLRLNVAVWPRLAGRERRREPTLKQLLSEPIIRTLMDADGVDSAELEAMLRQTSEALRATH